MRQSWVVAAAACWGLVGCQQRVVSPNDAGGPGGTDAATADAGLADSGSAPDSGTGPAQWRNIGMADPRILNANDGGVDATPAWAGRVNALRVSPANPDVAYLGAAGGGVWKSVDFTSASPHWQALTDGLPHLSISALELDPQNPDTVYAAVGDLDGFLITINGFLTKSTNGGASLSPPARVVDQASGTQASIIWDVRVDPTQSQVVLVGTDVGLFRSTDGAATFSLVSLPVAGGAQVEVSVHSIAFAGASNGVSAWVVAGVSACAPGASPPTFTGSPVKASCPVGNLGDLWRSVDGAVTWTSMRAGVASSPSTFPTWNQLPDSSTTSGSTGLGRIQLATNATASSDPGSSVLYALAMAIDAHASVDVLRSVDGGQTWSSIWLGTASTVSNPTSQCPDLGVAQRRTGAIVVDPTDSNHVLIGGTLCAVRTLSGLGAAPVFDNVMNGVHADWRTESATASGGNVAIYSGNDGGLYRSTNLFSVPQGSEAQVLWTPMNQGLLTQLTFGLGSGDPADGNTGYVLTGSQDIGAFVLDAQGSWDFAGGGDVSGAVVNGRIAWWASELFTECDLVATDCRLGSNWHVVLPILPSGDTMGLAEARLSPLFDGTGRVLSTSKFNVWLSAPAGASGWSWVQVTPNGLPASTTNVFASPVTPGLFGVTMSDGTCSVTGNGLDGVPSWTRSAPLGDGTTTLPQASMIAFAPESLPGAQPGDVYLASSSATVLAGNAPIPDTIGHLFVTRDRGATWQPFHGAGMGQDLPNAPISVVRYDPRDSTGSRIYAATSVGVFLTTDGGMTWAAVGRLPAAPVTDLFISRDGRLLRASTLGRGIWELSPAR